MTVTSYLVTNYLVTDYLVINYLVVLISFQIGFLSVNLVAMILTIPS